MQKKLLAVAVLSAFSGLAAAQSANVTLYGTILGDFQNTGTSGGDGTGTALATGQPAGANSSFRLNALGNGVGAVAASGSPGLQVPTTAASSTSGNLGNRYLNSQAIAAGTSQAAISSAPNRNRENSAGTNFGIRGTEDLGNGLSAWFQMELSATLGGGSAIGEKFLLHVNLLCD